MRNSHSIVILAIILFLFYTISGAYSGSFSRPEQDNEEINRLLKEADEAYQNGNFKQAIEKYKRVIQLLNEKKELAETKQELFQTLASLALTYFTIQENQQAEVQLEKLVRANPNYELDPEFFPPRLIVMFQSIQQRNLATITILTSPENADITINNKNIGKSPLKSLRYIKGKYILKATLAGYQPHSEEIEILAGEEKAINITLKKEEIKPVVQKKVVKPKKMKKKRSILPWVLAGVAVVGIAAVLLLSGKKEKEEPKPELRHRIFECRMTPLPIEPNNISWGVIQVENFPRSVHKIAFHVDVNFPDGRHLFIEIQGPDEATRYTIWNRDGADIDIIEGESDAFNNLFANGNWAIIIGNGGPHRGEMVTWVLRIYYLVN